MSKFIFSLFATESIKNQIVLFSDEVKSEYGYKYVERWEQFYDTSTGMDDRRFQSNETQFYRHAKYHRHLNKSLSCLPP
ncbi:MAG: hypothetical protein IPJ39_19795 [Saprospiraceae bacterium]|nr:hypothetical protein [Saprospiraceae bacterium]